MDKKNAYKFDNVDDIKRFIIGGKAIITLESNTTGRWFTYRIKKAKKEDENSPFFVSVLTGSNNEESYTYMGTIFNNSKMSFKLTKNSKIGDDTLSFKAFEVFFKLLMNDKLHADMNIYHQGICSVCNKKLTTPESLRNGMGSHCFGSINSIFINKTNINKTNNIYSHL